jgi:hypothetical protein
VAAKSGQSRTALLLVEKGASVDITNGEGKTPYEVVDKKKIDLYYTLMSYSVKYLDFYSMNCDHDLYLENEMRMESEVTMVMTTITTNATPKSPPVSESSETDYDYYLNSEIADYNSQSEHHDQTSQITSSSSSSLHGGDDVNIEAMSTSGDIDIGNQIRETRCDHERSSSPQPTTNNNIDDNNNSNNSNGGDGQVKIDETDEENIQILNMIPFSSDYRRIVGQNDTKLNITTLLTAAFRLYDSKSLKPLLSDVMFLCSYLPLLLLHDFEKNNDSSSSMNGDYFCISSFQTAVMKLKSFKPNELNNEDIPEWRSWQYVLSLRLMSFASFSCRLSRTYISSNDDDYLWW